MELLRLSEAIAAPDGRVGTALNVAVYLETSVPFSVELNSIVSAPAEYATCPGYVYKFAP
jgi:hypothetical protein